MAALSGRSLRIYKRGSADGRLSIIVQSIHMKKVLFIQSSAMLVLNDDESLTQFKETFTKIADAYALLGIIKITDENTFLIVVQSRFMAGSIHKYNIFGINGVTLIPLDSRAERCSDLRVQELERFLSCGSFYYAISNDPNINADLTVCSQMRYNNDVMNGTHVNPYYWNRGLRYLFLRNRIDVNEWLVRMICGSVMVRTAYDKNNTVKLALISRVSCSRVGTRFNVRGIDDDGNVANFVETEQIIECGDNLVSYVMVRGSVPIFWDQPGINVGPHKVEPRFIQLSGCAFRRHFRSLIAKYGKIFVINLLGESGGEGLLSRTYQAHFRHARPLLDIVMFNFDYHAKVKCVKDHLRNLMVSLDQFPEASTFFHVNSSQLLRRQNGVYRVNCLDCIDRTNSVQTFIGIHKLKLLLSVIGVLDETHIKSAFEEMWKNNGNACSQIYAGTGAIDGTSRLRDAGRSMARTIQNNFFDASRQGLFDFLLYGQCINQNQYFYQMCDLLPRFILHECPQVAASLIERKDEMLEDVPLTVFAGTWNVNGGKIINSNAFDRQTPLSEWLFPSEIGNADYCPDIYAIGLEEVVDLNAANIVSANSANAHLWCKALEKTLQSRGNYVLLASEQLVGVCLFVFVKPELMQNCRGAAISSVKTGLGGATGNKGSVAIRVTIFTTTFCFVCSHFAAGMNEIRDRNDDFNNAVRKIQFQRRNDIKSHEVVIWIGDFNYRIALLRREDVISEIQAGKLIHLSNSDQLVQQRKLGAVFEGFHEGPLCFPPTYKYDTFTDVYDSSDKARVPAWTDRVLWRDANGKIMKLLWYCRAELKSSDHRPVYAVFRIYAKKIVHEKCERLFMDILSDCGPPDSKILVRIEGYSMFPYQYSEQILNKLNELQISPIMWNIVDTDLVLIFANGVEAMVALSLDGVRIDQKLITARLHTPDWIERTNEEFKQSMDTFQRMTAEKCEVIENGDEFEFGNEEFFPGKSVLSKDQAPVEISTRLRIIRGDSRSHSTPALTEGNVQSNSSSNLIELAGNEAVGQNSSGGDHNFRSHAFTTSTLLRSAAPPIPPRPT